MMSAQREVFEFLFHDGRILAFDVTKINEDIAAGRLKVEASISDVDISLASTWVPGTIQRGRFARLTEEVVKTKPIVCIRLTGRDGVSILDGHHRYLAAAIRFKHPEVRILVVAPEDARRYVVSGVEHFDEFAKG